MRNNIRAELSKSALIKKQKRNKRLIVYGAILAVIFLALVVSYFVQSANNDFSKILTVEDAQKIVDEQLSDVPNVGMNSVIYGENDTYVKVDSIVEYGTARNVVLDCTYTSRDYSVLANTVPKYFETAYNYYYDRAKEGKNTTGLDIKLKCISAVKADLAKAEVKTGKITLEIFEVSDGEFVIHRSDDVVNTVFSGILDVVSMIDSTNTIKVGKEDVDITNSETLRTGVKYCLSLKNYDDKKPDTSIPLIRSWNNFKTQFYQDFIYQDRYMYYVNGLLTTLSLTACALVLGIMIGFVVAVIRVINQKTGKLDIAADICKVYLAVMRGMPVMVQIMIIHFVLMAPNGVGKFVSAVCCFGLNSGAYVSEIIRGGIMSVDEGQTEAGRSLGFNYPQTMVNIIIPQAFKAVLPSLGNEFIALLKETSIAFYIGLGELTLAGIRVRSQTYHSFMPLIAVGIIYLIVVLGLSYGVSVLERRLSKGDKR